MSKENLLKVVIAPIVTEKSQIVADKNKQFVFRVAKTATKPQIKAAVQELFKVDVKTVTVTNVKGKKKRFGRMEGKRADWKKAYVSLAEGHDISFVNAEA